MNWNLRPAHSGDLPAIKGLVNLAYRVEDFFIDGDRTDGEDLNALLADGGFLLAESPGRELRGSVYVRLRPPHPVAQGSGLGKFLIRAAERHCLDRGCSEMDLSVVNLRTELIPWYTKLGYSEIGTEPFVQTAKLSQPAHFVLMSRHLGGASKGDPAP